MYKGTTEHMNNESLVEKLSYMVLKAFATCRLYPLSYTFVTN
jgi:hypothetical protein